MGEDDDSRAFDGLEDWIEQVDTSEDTAHLTATPAAHTTAGSAPSAHADDHVRYRIPKMPSTCTDCDPCDRLVELSLRKRQAARHLQCVREAIAEKSFQYSHVIRPAPRKNVKTRARSSIAKLSSTISFHAMAYTKCRTALVRLHADADTLRQFCELKAEDLKSSTALLNPNQPGSTSMRLSWIWQAGLSGRGETPERLRECTNLFIGTVTML